MKNENRMKLNARAQSALENMYHNATPNYPREMYGRTDDYFRGWFDNAAEQELSYISTGGAYGTDYRATLAAPCNAGKYKSAAARRAYILKGEADMIAERRDCGMLTGWRVMELAAGNKSLQRKLAKHGAIIRNNSLWETATDYGDIVQYGCGGRSLAPADLIRHTGGGGYSILNDAGDEMSAAACTELIQVIESFNRYVGAWCASVPEMWREYCAEEDQAEHCAKVRASVRKAKETRERNYWAARDCATI